MTAGVSMPISCRRWVTLASAGPRRHPHAEPGTYLLFLNTGFLVGLPDERGTLLEDEASGPRFLLRDTDAAGLGLVPEDLNAGVAVCRVDGATGWHCDPVTLVDDEAYPSSVASRLPAAGTRSTARPSVAAEVPRQPLMLVFISPDHLRDGCLERAAEIAGAQEATVVLAAVGEVPETALHAAEERAALARMLEMAAPVFGRRVRDTCIEMGGDPVHGMAELVAESQPDIVLLPHEVHVPSGGADLARPSRTTRMSPSCRWRGAPVTHVTQGRPTSWAARP